VLIISSATGSRSLLPSSARIPAAWADSDLDPGSSVRGDLIAGDVAMGQGAGLNVDELLPAFAGLLKSARPEEIRLSFSPPSCYNMSDGGSQGSVRHAYYRKGQRCGRGPYPACGQDKALRCVHCVHLQWEGRPCTYVQTANVVPGVEPASWRARYIFSATTTPRRQRWRSSRISRPLAPSRCVPVPNVGPAPRYVRWGRYIAMRMGGISLTPRHAASAACALWRAPSR